MKEINVTIRKCPEKSMGERFKGSWLLTYIIDYKDKEYEVPPNYTIDRLVKFIKGIENSL